MYVVIGGCVREEPARAAKEMNYFDDEGLDVTFIAGFNSGMETIKGMLEGKADFAVSSETPFIKTVINRKTPYLVARKDKGILSAEDLNGKKIGVTIGSNGEYFFNTVLLINRIDKDAVTIVNVKPKDMYDAITEGRVDAIATWNPQLRKVKNDLGGNAVIFTAGGMYSTNFIISTSKVIIETRPDIVKQMLGALIKASDYIKEHKEEANRIAEKYLKLSPDLLSQLSAEYYFDISLNHSLLVIFENQTQWLIMNKPENGIKIPNYTFTVKMIN